MWIKRAVNRSKLHTPKYHRANRPFQLIQEDVRRLLELKKRMKAGDDDWMFPHARKTGPNGHEQIMGKKVQPVARKLGLPHITWRLLRHWGTTQMVEKRVPTRPDILLKHYAHVLDESTEFAAEALSSQLSAKKAELEAKNPPKRSSSPSIGSQTAASNRRWIM